MAGGELETVEEVDSGGGSSSGNGNGNGNGNGSASGKANGNGNGSGKGNGNGKEKPKNDQAVEEEQDRSEIVASATEGQQGGDSGNHSQSQRLGRPAGRALSPQSLNTEKAFCPVYVINGE